MRATNLITTLLAASVAAADGYHHYTKPELVLSACKASISSISAFCTNDTAKSYKCSCNTPQGLGSLMNCMYNETVEYSHSAEEEVLKTCATSGKTKLTVEDLRDAYDNATQYLTDITVLPGYNSTNITHVPVYYSVSVFKNTYKSTYVRYRNEDWGMWMGGGLLGFWAFIFLVATCCNVLNKMFFLTKHLQSHPTNLVRKYITLPALGAKRHTHPMMILKVIGGFIPTRWESIVIFCYFVLNVVFSATGYEFVAHDTIWKTRAGQMSRYPGDRTGILCLFGFILSFLFAGRNNFLIFITGWKQSTFLTYHKWVSRINFLLLVTHGGSMTVQSKGLGPGRYETRLKQPWMRWGIVSLICLCCILITASYRVRKTHYEVFVASHLVLVTFFLAGAWIHARDFGYEQFTYAMAALWCFDRFVRIVRVASFGIRKAEVTVVSEEVLRVTVPRYSMWKAYPGAYGYLHYMLPTTFFQSHPFTIVETSDSSITFYTKIKGGVTSQIHRHLSSLPNKSGQIPVSVEGPYGHQRPIHRFDTVLYYTGGTGVPTAYAYILDSVAKGLNQHMKFYWVIRNWNSLDWFYDELIKLRNHNNVQVIIYVTKPDSQAGTKHLSSSSSEDSSDSVNEESEKTSGIHSSSDEKTSLAAGMPPKSLDFIEFRYGRPNIDVLVEEDIKESNGTTAVFSAAHSSMVDDVRFAVSQNLDKSKHRVEYLEELQAW